MEKVYDLICSVRELTGIFRQKTNIYGLLNIVVKLVAKHINTEACSIFLFDEVEKHLVLRATAGLNSEFIGKIKLKIGEGITGKAFALRKPIMRARGSEDPDFKYIPGMLEEKYESILAVPIEYHNNVRGVILMEDSKPGYYTEHDIRALNTIASQLATFIENARLMLELKKGITERFDKNISSDRKFFKGRSASSGVAVGKSVFFAPTVKGKYLELEKLKYEETLEDFETALEKTIEQLEVLQSKMNESLSEAGSLIFAAHLLMVSDDDFSGTIRSYIHGGMKASRAIVQVVNEYIDLFSTSENSSIQEKIVDMRDLGHRLLRNLACQTSDEGDYSGQIIVAWTMLPSELVKLAAQHTEGFVMYGVGVTSHIAILARSLNIPVVFLTEPSLFSVRGEHMLVVDAYQGIVLLNPEEELIEKYLNNRGVKDSELSVSFKDYLDSCVTRDGKKITVQANINILSDANNAIKYKAEGAGLYRSEFLFLIRNDFPTEEEQLLVYGRLLDVIPDVVFRTIDIGGDKILGTSDNQELNPSLGLRALRYSLKHVDDFKIQLRALLRVGAGKKLKILLPLVTGVDDFLRAKEIIFQTMSALEKEGLPFNSNPLIGAMIELPSTVYMIDEIVENADFISIGTNDLTQYILGIDRTNEKVSDLYIPHHPSVMRALSKIAASASAHHCPVSVCGDTAADPDMLEFFVGLGIYSFSMDPRMIQFARREIVRMDLESAREFAEEIISKGTVKEIEDVFSKRIQSS